MKSFLIFARNLRRLPPAWRYGLSTIFVLAALGGRALLANSLLGHPFLLFFPAVMLSALLFDNGSSIFSSILSAILAIYFLVPLNGEFLPSRSDLIATAIFLATCLGVAAIFEFMRKLVDRLDAAERSKDVFLQEANHRFQNNLQIVASLLTLQARKEEDPATRAALSAAADRVQVIARIHQRFQVTSGSDSIAMNDYLEELGADLGNSLRGARPIAVRVAAAAAQVEVGRAVQIGLIVNELVTNALKYAFPDGAGGAIDVGFRVEQNMAVIAVSDDGIGLPANTVPGLGTRLVDLLAQQLGGKVSRVPAGAGVTVVIRVPL